MIRRIAVVLCSLVVAACGFHLRGSADLPFATLNIALPESSVLRAKLARTIASSSKTQIVADAKDAQAILSVLSDTQAKKILSLNSAGRVTEYGLERVFVFQVNDAAGQAIIPRGSITVRRTETFSDALVLSKQAEEVLLWEDMENDLLQQLLRRLAAAKPQPAEDKE